MRLFASTTHGREILGVFVSLKFRRVISWLQIFLPAFPGIVDGKRYGHGSGGRWQRGIRRRIGNNCCG